MSKLNDLRIALAKMLSDLTEVVLEDGTKIAYETLEVGSEVYLVTENGEYADIPDGEYKVGEVSVEVKEGKIVESESVVELEEVVEPKETEDVVAPKDDLRAAFKKCKKYI